MFPTLLQLKIERLYSWTKQYSQIEKVPVLALDVFTECGKLHSFQRFGR
jgi:hypothetical protein